MGSSGYIWFDNWHLEEYHGTTEDYGTSEDYGTPVNYGAPRIMGPLRIMVSLRTMGPLRIMVPLEDYGTPEDNGTPEDYDTPEDYGTLDGSISPGKSYFQGNLLFGNFPTFRRKYYAENFPAEKFPPLIQAKYGFPISGRDK